MSNHGKPKKTVGKSDNIRRAERKEDEARALLREAAYLRNLAKRLASLDNGDLSDA